MAVLMNVSVGSKGILASVDDVLIDDCRCCMLEWWRHLTRSRGAGDISDVGKRKYTDSRWS